MAKGELAPLFFHPFVNSWVPSLGLDRGQAKLLFFSFFFVAFVTPSPTLGKRGAYSFFLFVASKTPSPIFGKKGVCSPFFHLFCCFWNTMAKSQ
jgi:hypothetical protein